MDIQGFTAVDRGDDAMAFVALMDRVESSAGVDEARRAAVDALALRPGQRVLDVGCGTGGAVPALAARVAPGGEIVGVDLSEAMLAVARERHGGCGPVRFEPADAQALPFDSSSFSACRTERMMNHVPDPVAVVSELARVTQPGGRLAVIDVDVETTLIDSTDPELARIAAVAAADRLANGRVARRLEVMVGEAGFGDVRSRPLLARLPLDVVRLTFADLLCGLVADGSLDPDRLHRWWADLEARDASGSLVAYMPFFVVSGTRHG